MEETDKNFTPKVKQPLIWVSIIVLLLVALVFLQDLLKNQVVWREPTPSPTATPTSTPSATPTPGRELLEITGIIGYTELEGGCWYIAPGVMPCEGERCPLYNLPSYEPLNLPDSLRTVGLKAKFKLEIQQNTFTICQIGPAVKILDYQILK